MTVAQAKETYYKEHERLKAENEALKAQLAALETRINNGARVYAEPGFDGDIEAYERWHKPSNATLLLD